jgi:hypothetical protein
VVVLRDDRDTVAFFDAQAPHQIRPAVYPLTELIVSQAQIAGDYRLSIAVYGQSALEEIILVEWNYHDKPSGLIESAPLATLFGLDGAQLSTKSALPRTCNPGHETRPLQTFPAPARNKLQAILLTWFAPRGRLTDR